MRYVGILIVTFIFTSIKSQINEWNSNILIANNIQSVIVYMKVPSTNPDADKDGLLKFQYVDFNKYGLAVNDTCYNCLWIEHDGTKNKISSYQYNDRVLVGERTNSFDTVSFLFEHDKDFIIKYGKNFRNERISIGFIREDINGAVQSQINLDYKDSYQTIDSICQVIIDLKTYDYSHKDTLVLLKTCLEICLSRKTFDLINTSYEKTAISDLLKDLSSKCLDITDTSVFVYNKYGNIDSINEINRKTLFFYDTNNLIKSKIIKFNSREIEFVYKYKRY